MLTRHHLLALCLSAVFATAVSAQPTLAAKPLFRDPVYDGAADQAVIWNPAVGRWWMFYTNRRANAADLPGVTWVHGTQIGIAESDHEGNHWSYLGTAGITLPVEIAGTEPTLWAPEIITTRDGRHHLFLTVVPGVFADWNHPRQLVHLTSADLRNWNFESRLQLPSDRVIDAAIAPRPDGGWRLWYNDERDGKSIRYADSADLATWQDRGRADGVDDRCEAPFVFSWRGHHWLLTDTWKGLAVYRSPDLTRWQRQSGLLLATPGRGADDGVTGGHPAVVVSADRAFLFYFTHPGRSGAITPGDEASVKTRRSSIQVTELHETDGVLTCDRDNPIGLTLRAPAALSP